MFKRSVWFLLGLFLFLLPCWISWDTGYALGKSRGVALIENTQNTEYNNGVTDAVNMMHIELDKVKAMVRKPAHLDTAESK